MARYTRADIYLLVDALRDVLNVLRTNRIRVTPPGIVVIKVIPRWIQVAVLSAALPSRFVEVGGAYHISQAPDEMVQLIKEVRTLVEKSGLAVPAIRRCWAWYELRVSVRRAYKNVWFLQDRRLLRFWASLFVADALSRELPLVLLLFRAVVFG